VTLRVYDVSGKLVRNVLDRPLIGGNHTVRWNGRDEDGRPVVPGLYLLRLTAPGVELVEKAVRLR
jgi:flagellar hook assembly protein FlgD